MEGMENMKVKKAHDLLCDIDTTLACWLNGSFKQTISSLAQKKSVGVAVKFRCFIVIASPTFFLLRHLILNPIDKIVMLLRDYYIAIGLTLSGLKEALGL